MMSGFKPITEKSILRDVLRCADCEDRGLTANPKVDAVSVNALRSALAGLRERVDVPNPYPVDVFPELSPKELPLIDDVLRREFGFPLDRLSAFIGRRLFENYKKKTLEDIDYYFQLEEV